MPLWVVTCILSWNIAFVFALSSMLLYHIQDYYHFARTLPSVSSNGGDEWVAWHSQGSRALPLAERSPCLWRVDCEHCAWFICLPSRRPSVSLTGEAQAGDESPVLWRRLGHRGRGETWRTERRSEEGGPSEALYFRWVGSLWRDSGGGAEGHGQKALKYAGERWSLDEGGNS